MSDNKIIQVSTWNAITLWSYNIQSVTCAICRNDLQQPCLDCQVTESPGECTVYRYLLNNHRSLGALVTMHFTFIVFHVG